MATVNVQKFGKYEILEELGQGGMGVVYRARDPVIGRMVALKTLTPSLANDADLLKRFYREAQSAGNLQHPNIVTIYDLGEADGKPYIAMELVEGETLLKIISSRSPMPLGQKLKIILQFCRGLDHAHKHGVVHRDVKPGNILVRADGTVKVVDFGIVHLESTTITKTGMFIGTIHYAPPEQLNEGHVDARSDLWSVGVVMYELLTYQRPFDGPSPAVIITKILSQDPPSIDQVNSGIPHAVAELVQKCLRKDPLERFQSLEDLVIEMEPVSASIQHAHVDEWLGRVPELIRTGDLGQARNLLRNVLAIDSTNTQAKNLMHEVSSTIRRLEASSRCSQAVVDGESLLKLGEYAEAVRTLEEAVKLDSQHVQARSLLGDARRELARATEIRQGLAAGRRAYQEGDLTSAEMELNKVVQLDEKNTAAATLLNQIREERAGRARHFQLREGAWEIESLLKQGRFDEAKARTDDLERMFPDAAQIAELRAAAKQAIDGRQEAANELIAIQELLEERKFGEAVDRAQTMRAEFPQNPEVTQLWDNVKTVLGPQFRETGIAGIRDLVGRRDFEGALKRGQLLQRDLPGNAELTALIAQAEAGKRESAQPMADRAAAASGEPAGAGFMGATQLGGINAAPASSKPEEVDVKPAGQPPKPRKSLLLAAVVVVAAAIGGAIVLLPRLRPHPAGSVNPPASSAPLPAAPSSSAAAPATSNEASPAHAGTSQPATETTVPAPTPAAPPPEMSASDRQKLDRYEQAYSRAVRDRDPRSLNSLRAEAQKLEGGSGPLADRMKDYAENKIPAQIDALNHSQTASTAPVSQTAGGPSPSSRIAQNTSQTLAASKPATPPTPTPAAPSQTTTAASPGPASGAASAPAQTAAATSVSNAPANQAPQSQPAAQPPSQPQVAKAEAPAPPPKVPPSAPAPSAAPPKVMVVPVGEHLKYPGPKQETLAQVYLDADPTVTNNPITRPSDAQPGYVVVMHVHVNKDGQVTDVKRGDDQHALFGEIQKEAFKLAFTPPAAKNKAVGTDLDVKVIF